MATVRHFWHGFIHRSKTFMYPQYSRPLIYHLLPNVWKVSYTISASIFVPYWPPYSTDKFISCVVLGPSQWFFHFGEEIVIAWTHIGWVQWMFQHLPLPAEQDVHDSSGVTPYIVMKNDGVLYYQVSISPERWTITISSPKWNNHCEGPGTHKRWTSPCYRAVNMEHQQSERTTVRDPVQHKRWTCPCCRAVSKLRTWTKMDAMMVYFAFQTFGKRW